MSRACRAPSLWSNIARPAPPAALVVDAGVIVRAEPVLSLHFINRNKSLCTHTGAFLITHTVCSFACLPFLCASSFDFIGVGGVDGILIKPTHDLRAQRLAASSSLSWWVRRCSRFICPAGGEVGGAGGERERAGSEPDAVSQENRRNAGDVRLNFPLFVPLWLPVAH